MNWKCNNLFWCLVLGLTSVLGAQVQNEKLQGCTAPLLLPDLPFFVVWNHPSSRCEDHGIDLGLQKWGIVENQEDQFFGSKISLFYGSSWKWPHIDGTKSVFGGIPQLGNLIGHLANAKQDVGNTIKNRNFTGLSVIDFEYWRPLFRLNFDTLNKYQLKSIQLAKQMFPNMTDAQLKEEATEQFNKAGRLFVEETLNELSSLRPYGKWGYYGYPRCWGKSCTGNTISTNDEMGWVFNRSSGLYPSIYFQLSVDPQERARIIKGKLKETLRVKAKFSQHDATIFPYANNQNGPYHTFQKSDLDYSIGLPANLGASGVVLWGSSASMRAKNECQVLQDYVNTTLGPYVQNVTNFFSTCSRQLCEGHGRCVRVKHEAFYQHHLAESGRTDCLIPKEQFKRGQRKSTLKKRITKLSNSIRRSRATSFLDVIRKRPRSLLTNGLRNKEGLKLDIRGEPTSVISNGDRSFVLGTLQDYDFQREIPDQHSAQTVNFSVDGSSDNVDYNLDTEDDDRLESLDFKLPNDFDDYVCKCFSGWAGTHCRQKQEDNSD